MVTALFVAVLASAYDQRRESLKTRDKIDESSSRIQSLEGKFTVFEGKFTVLEGKFTVLEGQHATLSAQLAELKLSTDKNHAEISGSLADARERLARIEGYLRINPPSTDPEPDH